MTDTLAPARLEAATIPGLLRQAARRYTSATALAAEGREPTTYEGLCQFARESRRALFAAGIEPGQRMALAMPFGAEAVTLNLVAMSTGIALPLNPGLPRAAAVAQLQLLKPSVVIASDTLPVFREAAAELGLLFVGINGSEKLPAGQFHIGKNQHVATQRDHDVSPPFLPFSTAAVLQTSGSTGEPKRVPLTHANLLAGAAAIERSMELTEGDRFLNVTPHFRVVGLGLVLAALKAGNAIYCAPGFLRAQFLDWAEAFEPTWFWAAPAMLKELLPLAQVRGAHPCGEALRVIRTGSANLSPDWLAPLEAAFGVPVVENYGMTEASPQIACNPLDRVQRRPGSVGKAAGAEILILNSNDQPAPAGTEGEILIRGAGVTSGYEGEALSASGPNDAFWNGLGSRWFRTGDLGHLDADGYLYVAGRRKEMINRGGEKVWPRDVEQVLERHPAVEQAVVFAVPHATLGEEVGAAIVLRPTALNQAELDEAELRAFACEHLASYQTPTRIAFLPANHHAIHAAPGGKLQRSQMAARLDMTSIETSNASPATYVVPTTALERELAAIWSSILRAPRIGLDDDFFQLGGDSLAIATLSAALHDRFGVMRRLLDRADFFAHPTIRAQALMIDQAQRARAEWKTQTVAVTHPVPSNLAALNARPRRSEDVPPLFLAPLAGASPLYLRKFAQHMAAQQLCYGMEAHNIPSALTLEQLAAAFVTSIEAICPEGPFYLGGHCFGGVLAYEIAQQFAAKGRQPETLYLFDVPTPGYPHPWRERHLFAKALWHHAREFSQYGRYAGAALRHVHKLNAARLESVGISAGDDASVRLMRLYEAKPYAGAAAVFVARNHVQTASPLDRRLGWRNLIQPEPELVHIDSAHLDLFDDPHAMELAAICLDRLPHRSTESGLELATAR